MQKREDALDIAGRGLDMLAIEGWVDKVPCFIQQVVMTCTKLKVIVMPSFF